MSTIKDLGPCHHLPVEGETFRAVGWLGPDSDYPRGAVSGEFKERLKDLCAAPWQPFISMGFHQCELCQFDGPKFNANVFVPYDGTIYIAPVGVVHYIAAHWYQPPGVFIQAVLACPPMRSMQYYKAIIANGGRSLSKPP